MEFGKVVKVLTNEQLKQDLLVEAGKVATELFQQLKKPFPFCSYHLLINVKNVIHVST
jgi:hypothetical protein